ncbi:LOW QUALITY PROTEIN: GapPol Polyprotein [Phytophthora palmivora]|uniref:GapPol Polyprotein n=1 Tax=Phytophthora palmivora TaxID=4796 RepID=A0A2P4XFR0_9STRA|nr:LOW QUALITY PROTEIN: GapPol Polyprotein [Phytophthora palmivora]
MTMIAFQESDSLALDAQLRAKVLLMAPHYNGELRRVHTRDKVRRYAYWYGWKRVDDGYVSECATCGSEKGYRPWKNGLMQKMPSHELSGLFSLLDVDAVGPLVTTPRDNKFMLVFADYFTRWG